VYGTAPPLINDEARVDVSKTGDAAVEKSSSEMCRMDGRCDAADCADPIISSGVSRGSMRMERERVEIVSRLWRLPGFKPPTTKPIVQAKVVNACERK
jgi:hypothetical protein